MSPPPPDAPLWPVTRMSPAPSRTTFTAISRELVTRRPLKRWVHASVIAACAGDVPRKIARARAEESCVFMIQIESLPTVALPVPESAHRPMNLFRCDAINSPKRRGNAVVVRTGQRVGIGEGHGEVGALGSGGDSC